MCYARYTVGDSAEEAAEAAMGVAGAMEVLDAASMAAAEEADAKEVEADAEADAEAAAEEEEVKAADFPDLIWMRWTVFTTAPVAHAAPV